MLVTGIANLIINLISVLLAPFTFVTSIFTNVFADTKMLQLLKFFTFYFNKLTLIFLINTFIFWTSLFLIKPLIDFIRNRS